MCHSRKIKCDALKIYPCTKCRDANLQCTLRVSHRGKSRRQARVRDHTERSRPQTAQPSPEQSNPTPRPARRRTSATTPHSTATTNGASCSPVDLIRSLENFIDNPHEPVDGEGSVAVVHATNNNALTSILNAASGTDDITRRNVHLYVGPSTSCSAVDRYNDALARFDPVTREFIAAKRLFDLPDPPLADHLVENFFNYADPHVPILHKVDFLERYRVRKAPPLLMQAVLFVGSHFADDDFVADSPWECRDQMTSAFFEKAKLIADFELESDQITLVQSFVLLAERWLGWTQERNTRYWMSRAVNVAYMMGLHRRIETMNLSPAQQRFWSRVAWVTMARDCFVAASFGTPAVIDDRWTDKEYTVWCPSRFDESREGQESEYVPSRSPETVKYSVTLIWLGALMGHVLHKLHSWSRISAEPVTSAVLEEIREMLAKFGKDCPSVMDVEMQDTSAIPREHLIYSPLLRAAHALVSLFYYWSLAERHRDPVVKRESKEMLHAAAHDVCELMSYLRAQQLFRFCPVWLVAGVFHTMAVLLADCCDALLGSDEPRKTNSFGRLRQLNDDLSILEETWKPAGWFRELIRISLSKLQEKVRKRKDNPKRTPEPERQPPQNNTETAADAPLFCESPGTLFDSARELFPDLENIFSWNSAETFMLS